MADTRPEAPTAATPTPAPTPPPTCAVCSTAASETVKLSKCSACKTVSYCSKACQRAGWPEHKPACAPRSSRPRSPRESTHGSNFLRGMMWGNDNGSFLSGRSEDDCYNLLIDAWRMRVEDEYNFGGITQGLYAGEDPVPGLRAFLRKCERKEGVLPTWWNDEKKEACIRKGAARSGWSNLHSAVEKSDIQEHYGNPSMPMQLRMLAEEVIGTNVMNLHG